MNDYYPEDPDVIYVDVLLGEEGEQYGTASINISKDSPYINRPEDFYLQVEAIDLNGLSAPLLTYKPNTWYITYTYLGVDYNREVAFISRGSPLLGQVINTFQQMLEMINATIAQVYVDAGAPFTPPIVYPVADGKFQFRFELLDTGELFFSEQLSQFFKSIDVFVNGFFVPLNKNHTILHYNNGNNVVNIGGTDFVLMDQINTSQRLWVDAVRYILVSNNLPTTKEYININSDNKNIRQPIIANFVPTFSPIVYQTGINYIESNSRRVIDLHGIIPIRDIDLKIQSVDKYGGVSDIFLGPGETFSCKLMFIKKSLYKRY